MASEGINHWTWGSFLWTLWHNQTVFQKAILHWRHLATARPHYRPLWVSCLYADGQRRRRLLLGGKSTGWSGPRGDFIQKLQGSLLRVKLMADSTMNSFLTTATCPQRHSHQLRVSGAAINQPLRGGQREEKLKKGNRGWEWHREIVRVWGGEWLYSSSAPKQWDTSAPSKCSTPPSSSLWWGGGGGGLHSQRTDHTEKQFMTVWDVRQGLIFVPSPHPK